MEVEVYGKPMAAGPANVIFLSSILGRDGSISVHKCDWKCENEHVCGNIYSCKLTGLSHICDKNCNQRILYDNHSALCRVSGQIFPLSQLEQQAVRGVRRKLDGESTTTDSCSFKRSRRDAFHPSPFERSFNAMITLLFWQQEQSFHGECHRYALFGFLEEFNYGQLLQNRINCHRNVTNSSIPSFLSRMLLFPYSTTL